MLGWSCDQVALYGQSSRFDAAGDMQLGEDAADVKFDGRAANDQLRGNVGVAQPLDHQR
jgi:hypothetical protein